MTTKTHYTTQEYECAVTSKTEEVRIENITKALKSSRTRNANSHSFVLRNLEDCTGLDECGVKTTYGMSATYAWEKCPLIPILKNRK